MWDTDLFVDSLITSFENYLLKSAEWLICISIRWHFLFNASVIITARLRSRIIIRYRNITFSQSCLIVCPQTGWSSGPCPLPLLHGNPKLQSCIPDLFKLVHCWPLLGLFKRIHCVAHTFIGKRALTFNLKAYLLPFPCESVNSHFLLCTRLSMATQIFLPNHELLICQRTGTFLH